MGTSVSSAAMARIRTFAAAVAALALTLTFAPSALFADDSVAGPLAGPGYEGDARSASPNSALSSAAEGPTLASTLAGPTASIVSADVALDASDPIVGSFTAGGLTYALNDGKATLISVGATFVVAPYEGSADSGDGNAIAIPASVTYNGVAYPVTAIGPYAFYLSGVASVELPASVSSVDDRAFRSSDVERVEVDQANPNLASYEGCLYDSQLTSLLLIPEGRAGSVPIPSEAEVVEASKFSHCSLADAISVDGDGADFASWDGLLYSADGTTLLRVPAGATEITIHDGCTAIAVGTMEGCAKLERINAPASVTSISPDVFESVPAISLPIASALQDGSQDDSAAGPLAGPGYEGDARSASADSPAEGSAEMSTASAPQLTAMVALSSADEGIPEVYASAIAAKLAEGSDIGPWKLLGFHTEVSNEASPFVASMQSADAYGARYSRSFSSVAGWARAYYVGDTAPYFLCGYADLLVEWDKGDSTYPDVDAIADFFVSGYSSDPPLYGANPAYAAQLKNRWFREGCGPLIGFISWQQDFLSLAQIESGNFHFKLPADVFRNNSLFEFGYGFDPVFTRALHTYELNYPQAPGASSLYSDVNGEIVCPPAPTRAGYEFVGWFDTNASEGGKRVGVAGGIEKGPYLDHTFYARWKANTITCVWDSQGGSDVADTAQTYSESAKVVLPPPSTRQGYVFQGWWTAPDGGTQVTADTALPTEDATYYAQWSPTISADVPLEVTARVDLLGIEEQAPASGYIESRCGEPLKVAEVAMEPLSGATDLFGAGNEPQVRLQALAGQGATWQPGGANAAFSFPLGASAAESDAGKLAALAMASYGERIPISYRFDIPEALLPTLAETTKPVCQVAYTVALA